MRYFEPSVGGGVQCRGDAARGVPGERPQRGQLRGLDPPLRRLPLLAEEASQREHPQPRRALPLLPLLPILPLPWHFRILGPAGSGELPRDKEALREKLPEVLVRRDHDDSAAPSGLGVSGHRGDGVVGLDAEGGGEAGPPE